ncbi:hypothetical protein JTB14_018622 [Gonioctena quinquepunctata]|nr:hypothetical protein JTB14_018622 [Gonioctena quinquepunctata]
MPRKSLKNKILERNLKEINDEKKNVPEIPNQGNNDEKIEPQDVSIPTSTKNIFNMEPSIPSTSGFNESELEEKEEKLERKKNRLRKISEVKRNPTTPSAKGKSSLTSTSNAAKGKSTLILSQNIKKHQQKESSFESGLSDKDDDPECIFCGETYLCFHKDDGWIQCY